MSLSDENMKHIVNSLSEEVLTDKLNFEFLKAAENEASRLESGLADLKDYVISGLKQSGHEQKLANFVLRRLPHIKQLHHHLTPEEHKKEPITYIRKSQLAWEKRIWKSLNSMCTELSLPLARKRPDKDFKDMNRKWSELGSDEPNLSQIRPVYAPKDFLEVVSGVKNPNCNDFPLYNNWGLIQATLKVKSLHELRLQYSHMSINQAQSGVDDLTRTPTDIFQGERNKLAKKVIKSCMAGAVQEFLKKGSPTGCRNQIWNSILGIEIGDEEKLYYDQLKNSVLVHDLLVDNLIYKDIKLTATNDDQYFVFEDYLYQVLLPFFRDLVILETIKKSTATPAKSYIRGKLGNEEYAVFYPPNGVIPFHGFSMYVAPLCYCYDDPIMLYYVFRAFYARFFHHLHCVSSHQQGILSLSLLFERLLQQIEPQLFYHLCSIGVQPLKISFKWIIRAFSGYLCSEQVLLLWDRILAYDSLEILAVLAVAIFSFRKTNLLQIQSFQAAEAVMNDLTGLKVIPLLQLTLFSE
ncbi:DgyrCDS12037 [Dimorphilus gyrociliatus]|uniref:DgyrCDS12037 n=1 Tax=Dimorphilus gyrociliatus TaxID=2664684 RepID=A0A7I8W5E1_9ANNE|nr:DgyrCDS12037 [Dimorphilus gyrociliatus]